MKQDQLSAMERTEIKDMKADADHHLQVEAIQGETAIERLESLCQQVENPYCFRVGKTPVKVTFAENGASLESKLESYFLSLKNL